MILNREGNLQTNIRREERRLRVLGFLVYLLSRSLKDSKILRSETILPKFPYSEYTDVSESVGWILLDLPVSRRMTDCVLPLLIDTLLLYLLTYVFT